MRLKWLLHELLHEEWTLGFTKHSLLNTEKQNDKSFLKDGLFWMICSVEMGLVNFYYFYHHFLMVHINLSSLPKRIQQELS